MPSRNLILINLLVASLAAAAPANIQKRGINTNVLGGRNFPDPSIIDVDGVWYVFGTNDGAGNDVPLTSNANFDDAGGWSSVSNAFPPDGVPAFSNWAKPGSVWAPDVNQLTDGDGSFAMYYSAALSNDDGVHCIGLARSEVIGGPYNDSSEAPWICPANEGGAIDASGFLDTDNQRYVVYKIDGPAANGGGYCNSPSKKSTNTSLMVLPVGHDGYTQMAGSVSVYNNAGESDSYNIEAPQIKKVDGTYFLFFSSGCTATNSYTQNYVTSTEGIYGPYGNRQILLQTGDDYGPGGASISPDNAHLVFHSLLDDNSISGGRVLDTDTITLSGTTATIG